MRRYSAHRKLSPQPPSEPQRVSPRKRTRNMADQQNNALSDTEGGEKPVREQLKKANINAADGALTDTTLSTPTGTDDVHVSSSEARGKVPQKKRSFDEDEDESAEPPATVADKQHRRKRSRDSTAEEDELNNGQRKVSGERARDADAEEQNTGADRTTKDFTQERTGTPEPTGVKRTDVVDETIASPKIKRSRLHSLAVEGEEPVVVEQTALENTVPQNADATDSSMKESSKIAPASGFANTYVASPFCALPGIQIGGDSPFKSSTPFAATGISALSGSSSSGFGAVRNSSGGFGAGGGFGTGGNSALGRSASKEEDQSKKSTSGSTFGGALGQTSAFAAAGSSSSGFGSAASGFGKIGQSSGFGGGLGNSSFGSLGGGGLSSFASGKPTVGFASSSKPAKGFGVAADDDEDAEDAGDDEACFKSPLSQEEDKQDERFYYQDLETGEEDELTEYNCRAKLYNFAANPDGKKEWRERGLGILRLNVKKDVEAEGEAATKIQARFLMRADGSHRVVLNTPVKKEIKFGAPTGGPPQGGYMYFMGTIDGKASLELLQLKMRQQFAQELYDRVVELQGEM